MYTTDKIRAHYFVYIELFPVLLIVDSERVQTEHVQLLLSLTIRSG